MTEKDARADTLIPRLGEKRGASLFMEPREHCWNLILQQTGKHLEKRGYAVSIASSLKDAAKLVMETILPASGARSVSFGGSMTVLEAGLLEALKARPELTVLDTFDASGGPEAMIEVRRQALLCDLFICSANAMTRAGEIVLVDGIGNRTAAVQFGPRQVVLIISRNKISATLESAAERVKNLAAPANAIRLKKDTPCARVGYCMDCNSPDRICSVWITMQRCKPRGRIHVILVDEDTGF